MNKKLIYILFIILISSFAYASLPIPPPEGCDIEEADPCPPSNLDPEPCGWYLKISETKTENGFETFQESSTRSGKPDLEGSDITSNAVDCYSNEDSYSIDCSVVNPISFERMGI